jgi:hypothetical protein
MKSHFAAACLFFAMGLVGLARADDFYVACMTGNISSIIKISDGATTKVYTGNASFVGFAKDRSSDLFIPDPAGNQILEFPAVYGAIADKPIVFAANLNAPQNLAFDSKGDLYEIEANGNINEFVFAHAKLSNQPVLAIDGSPNGAGLVGARQPITLGFDAHDNLFVGILIGGILEFPRTAKGLSTVPQVFSTISRARQLAFDTNGNLFVVNHLGGDVGVYEYRHSASGLSHNPLTFAQGDGLDAPTGIAFDSQGDLYVANWGSGAGTTVLRYPRTKAGLARKPVVFAQNLNAPYWIIPVKGGMVAMARR